MLSRRTATLALSAIIGVLAGKVKAMDVMTSSDKITVPQASIIRAPQAVIFDLKGFTSYEFSYEGKTVTLTPEELFRALSE